MAETTALDKHSCAACGARAEWTPSKQALICAFCGTVSPAELDRETGRISEIDLVRTLREIPDDLRGWQGTRRTVKCRSCHAISVFEAERVGQNCEFCGSPELVDYDEIKAPIRPQSLLPFKLDETRVRERLRRWFTRKWLAPSRFKKSALLDTARGIYIPYWTFDAQTHCRWTAQSGYHYHVRQTYTDSNGKTRTRMVQRTRWQPSAGELDHFFDDEPIPATHGIDRTLLKQIEPFPTTDLVPYDTAYLSGFVVEHYQVVLVEAAQQARGSMEAQLRQLCGSVVPGDTYRNLQIDPDYSGETFKHILVPVWVLTYNYGSKSFPTVVNGYTGEVAGRYPKSGWKIFFLIATAALIIAALVLTLR